MRTRFGSRQGRLVSLQFAHSGRIAGGVSCRVAASDRGVTDGEVVEAHTTPSRRQPASPAPTKPALAPSASLARRTPRYMELVNLSITPASLIPASVNTRTPGPLC